MNEFSMSPIMLSVVGLALYVGVHVKKKIMGDTYIKILKTFLLILAVILIIQVST